MAFRIPHHLLSDAHKIQIRHDLCLKEQSKANDWYAKQKGLKVQGKEITFYSVDNETKDILLPMYYASCLFGRPHINHGRSYVRVPGFKMKTKLYDYQEEVVDISIQNFMKRGTTFLNVFCSFGKTVVAAYFAAMFAQQYGVSTLVTYPLTMIESSWIGTFRDLTTAKIYVVGQDQGIPDKDVQVFLCMDTRVTELDKSIRSRIGHVVYDEGDSFCTPGRVECLLAVEPLFITVLTATYERDDGFHKMLDLLVGPERITRISKKPFFVFQRPTPYTADPKVGPRGIVFDNLIAQLDSIQERNSDIIQTVIDNINEKILILTKHVPHAENLHRWISYYLQPYGKTCSLLSGTVKRYNDASVIVGTISKVGRGFDEKKACHDWRGERINMLILASSTKKIEQIAGRVFRADIPIIIDFVDDHKNTKTHWRLRKGWYESRNGVIYSTQNRFVWSQIKDTLLAQYMATLQNKPVANPIIQVGNVIIDNVVRDEQQINSEKLTKSHAMSAALKWVQMNK